MKKWLFLFILLMITQFGITQNLIPDGTFSIHNNIDCPPHFVSLQGSDYWYAAGNTTVDFYLPECEYNNGGTSTVNQFWTYPYYGNGFIGFWGVFRADFTMGSEVFGTVLSEALQPEQAYYFSTDVRYRGKGHPEEDIFPLYCPSDPPFALQVYTSIDTVRSDIDIRGAATQVFAENVLTLDSPAITDTFKTDLWTNVWGCFIANGGENHLGFSLTIDSFDAVAPCIGSFPDPWFSMSYYNMDNVELIPFPNYITDTLLFCKEDGFLDFDASTYFGAIKIENFEPVWEDGITGTKRRFETGGKHTFSLNYECGTTIFEIFIDEQKCDAQALVPDAFTPNFDGRNDELFPFFATEQPITNYEFMIFDRWGNLFYQSDEYDGFNGWDGTVNGKAAQNGVYVWTLKFDLIAPDETKSYQLSGDVLLIR